jgi:hypothetical protein
MSDQPTLRLSLRECRMILERLVQAAGAPSSVLHAVRDCALYSAILPASGLSQMSHQLDALQRSRPLPLALAEKADRLIADGRGQHAWYAAHTILDLAVEAYRLAGPAEICAINLLEPDELRVVEGLAEHHGLAARVSHDGDRMLVSVSMRASAPTLLDRLRIEGLPTPATVWWPLYKASLEALAPDSFESRRHAGTVRVEADGRIVGRGDEDETDLAMLTPDPSLLHS